MAYVAPTVRSVGDAVTAADYNIMVNDMLALATGYTYVTTLYTTSSGTFTAATYPYLRAARVTCIGGGGAGGGSTASGGGYYSYGSGGGAGAFSRSFILAGTIGATQTMTIGTAGAGVSNANGGTGGDTSFGSLVVAKGGVGGLLRYYNAQLLQVGSLGGAASGGTGDFKMNGTPGGYAIGISNGGGGGQISGQGGASILGGGGISVISGDAAGAAALANSGSGGSGSATANTGGNKAGGDGGTGIIIIDLFA